MVKKVMNSLQMYPKMNYNAISGHDDWKKKAKNCNVCKFYKIGKNINLAWVT